MINEMKFFTKFRWILSQLMRKKIFTIKERDVKNLVMDGTELEPYHFYNNEIRPFWQKKVEWFDVNQKILYDDEDEFIDKRYYVYIRNDGEEIAEITNRYGNYVQVKDRLGILDQKLSAISDDSIGRYLKKAERAFKSIYASHMSDGATVFLTRKNMFLTFVEHYVERFGKLPTIPNMKIMVTVIKWNINQSLFFGTIDWRTNEAVTAYTIKKSIEMNEPSNIKNNEGWDWSLEDNGTESENE